MKVQNVVLPSLCTVFPTIKLIQVFRDEDKNDDSDLHIDAFGGIDAIDCLEECPAYQSDRDCEIRVAYTTAEPGHTWLFECVQVRPKMDGIRVTSPADRG